MQRFIVLDKKVGETPLECVEKWRTTAASTFLKAPLTYAGRLDPMASGKLLVLIGDECTQKDRYLSLDKEYEFEVLFNVHSDTGDVLGLIKSTHSRQRLELEKKKINGVCATLEGNIKLPYPNFSSRTVHGKPLHTWTLEGRLDEIEIPTKQSKIYKLDCTNVRTVSKHEVYRYATEKIETIPPVTDPKKSLGNDFRRPLVRESWKTFHDSRTTPDHFTIATFRCIASSGTYMRTLAEVIAKEFDTIGIAYSIHRTKIGHYQKLPFRFGFWTKKY